jgi:hypothetical protein
MSLIKFNMSERVNNSLSKYDILPVNFNLDEQTELLLPSKDCGVSIDIFYDHFNIDKNQIKKYAKKSKIDNISFAGFFFDSLDSFFDYDLPSSILDITSTKIDQLDDVADDIYEGMYQDPPLPGPINKKLMETYQNLQSFSVWLFSLGQSYINFPSIEESSKDFILNNRQELIEDFKGMVHSSLGPMIAEDSLLHYISLKYDVALVEREEGYYAIFPTKVSD